MKRNCYRRYTRETQRSWISQFFNVTRSFVHKVRRELEAFDGNVESVAKPRKHKPRSDTVCAPGQRHYWWRSFKVHKGLSRDLQVSEWTIRRIVHEDIQYKSYVMSRCPFMYAQPGEQWFIQAKWLLKQGKTSWNPECALVLFWRKKVCPGLKNKPTKW